MSAAYDVVVIGGGHNGLTAAAYLARAGRRVLVLEQRHVLGGAAVTEEIFPGFRYSVFSYVVSLLRPEIIRELDLPRHGLEILPLDGTFTPMPDGDYLWRMNDHSRTRREIARHSRLDAEAYDEYGKAMVEMARFAKPLLAMTPPDPMSLGISSLRDLWSLAARFARLPLEDKNNQIKLLTTSAVDLLDAWFETDVLKATMSASGIIGTFLGVRSPGTAYVLLHHYMGEIDGAFRSWGLPRGGTGAVSLAIAAAAREAGAEIRTEAPVAKIVVKAGRATGVVLQDGEEIRARVVASSLDPRQTFTKLVGAEHLPEDLAADVARYKFRGSSGKVNLALDTLPDFVSLPGHGPHLRGAISISPSVDYMERAYDEAKYGRFSRRPYIDIVIPSLTDPSVAPPGKHVMSCFVQYAPYALAESTWDEQREAFGDAVVDTIAEHAPNLREIILHRQVLTPLDIERAVGLSEGNIFQGELTLEQLFFLRPGPGWARYVSPIRGLYVCGAAAHPGGGIDGGARAQLRAAHPAERPLMDADRDVVVIGAGHNGLVTAAILAGAGLRPLVLEARDVVGGRAVTEEIAPGFRCPTVLHAAGPLQMRLEHELRLARHGLEWLEPSVRLFAPAPDGPGLRIHDDPAQTAAGLRAVSTRDAERYPAFAEAFARIGAALRPALSRAPPNAETPGVRDVATLLGSARRVRALGKHDAYRLLRATPMAVADLLTEWFETDGLCAALAARGIYASFAGPRSAGTGAALLLQAAFDGHPTAPAAIPRGGMGALTGAIAQAAKSRGAEIRTGARVAHILVREGVARGVVLASGEEILARAVVSGADPRHTLLELVDASELGPGVTTRLRSYRCTGTAAKLNLALSRLPRFPAAGGGDPGALTGRIHIGARVDDLERAFDSVKYGELSANPTLDVTIPSLLDESLCPPGAHVMSIHAQFVPYALRNGDWSTRRDDLVKTIVRTLSVYAPDLPDAIVAHDLLTPVDLEGRFGLSGGHLLHGEMSLDQTFFMRPLLGWAQYRTPIVGLYLCGSGTHPGGAVTGASGANAGRAVLADLRSQRGG